MTPPRTLPLAETLALMLKEGRRRVLVLAAIFAGIALAGLVFGAMKPKEYEAHAVILVEVKNIITPLMEGRAVATGISDQASIASQAMQSRRILRELLAFGGWGEQKDPRVEERMLNRLSGRIRIVRPRPELIKLGYLDTDPERCFAMSKKIAEIFIREALVGKSQQSGAAFEFIDRQVTEYAGKLADAHAEVQAYYRTHGEPRRAAASYPVVRPAARPPGPRLSAGELATLRAEEAVLAAEVASVQQARQRRAERIEQLQRQLDALLGSYTDRHPNVARIREDLQLAREDSAKAAALEERATQAARARLEEVRSRLPAASDGAPGPTAALPFLPGLVLQPSPGEVIATQDATLQEMLRRYESTRDVYQDLLKRRENARVSRELDAEQRGLTLRVYEEPELPVLPTGMRLMHLVAIGLLLAVAAPLGLLFAFVRFDPRLRSPQQIERTALAPLLVTIPYAPTPDDRAHDRRRVVLALAVVGGVFATYAVFLGVRLGLVEAGWRLLSS